MQVSSCLSAFELRAIHLISLIISAQLFEMGNAECCDNKKNPEFKLDKAENLPSLKPVIREVSVNPKPPLIRHDKINSLEPHQSKVYTSEAAANNQLRSEAGKQRDSQLSQGSVQKIKAVESLKEFKTLQASQGPHLTESKVREYEIHQRQSETISVPELNPKVQATLQKYQFFKSQFKCEPRVMLFAGQAYSGEFQEEDERKLPSGYGKLYKSDGSLFLGEFAKGEAHGAGAYVFPDGSFYQGNFLSNLANDQNGFYKALNFEYRGGFRDNLFEGNGVEKTGDYIFEGLYSRGQKASGSLTWGNGCCCYKGPFVQDAFHGKGSLVEPTGTYHGDFNYGVKHGQGEYRFNNGLRYEGDYQNNKRQGRGALYNPTGHTPVYEGDFHDGLPHGEGFVYDEKGNRVASKWVMGIDSASLL